MIRLAPRLAQSRSERRSAARGAPAPPGPGWRAFALSREPAASRRYVTTVRVEGAERADALAGFQGAGSPLPHLDRIRRAFGRHDVNGARAYVGGPTRDAAGRLGGVAYASDGRVGFGGPPDLHEAAHEAAHLVQQRGGAETGATGAERHADAVADAVVEGRSAAALLDRAPRASARVQLRTERRRYATVARETGPVWDVELDVLDAPPAGSADLDDFVAAAMDGIRFAAGSLGSGGQATGRTIRVTMPYRAKRDYVAVQDDAYRLARASVLPREPASKPPAMVAPPPVAATPVAPAPVAPAKLGGERGGSQRLRARTIREIRAAMSVGFAVLDKTLPMTPAYAGLVKSRDATFAALAAPLEEAEALLARADASANEVQLRLERAQVGLHLLATYADLAALVRAAEVDKLVTNVIVTMAAEAERYRGVVELVLNPKVGPEGLAYIRGRAPGWRDDTRKKIDALGAAVAKGQQWVATAERVEKVLDVPIAFLKGLELPPEVLFLNLTIDTGGFAIAHVREVNALAKSGPPFFAELGWLDGNAPLTRRYVLHPMYKAIALEGLKSISAADIAFILGRTFRGIMKAGGSATWKIAVKALVTSTLIVGVLDSPKLAAHGIGRVAERTKEAMLKALGGEKDPYGIVADLNAKLEAKLSPEEAAALLLELTSPGVKEHIKYLAAAGEVVGPNIAAIITDLEGKGAATAATASGIEQLAVPLLPPAP
jgi:hypothetical protein